MVRVGELIVMLGLIGGICCAQLYGETVSSESKVPQSGYWHNDFTLPQKIYKTAYDIDRLPMEERFLLLSLAGIVAKQTKAPQIMLITGGTEKQWYDRFEELYPGTIETVDWSPWKFIEYFKKYVQGYVVYTKSQGELGSTKGANLAGVKNAIMVCEEMVETAKKNGLKELGDTRKMNEVEIFDTSPDYYQYVGIVQGVPWNKQWPWNFYWWIATKTFVVCIDPSGWTEPKRSILRRVPKRAPASGWSTAVSEYELVNPLTQYGFGITAIAGARNLPLFSLIRPGIHFPIIEGMKPHKTYRDIQWEDDVHYACIYISDLGNHDILFHGWDFWNDPRRKDPMRGWATNYGIGVGLAHEYCPLLERYMFMTSTPFDGFISDCSGAGGYYFPDHWGIETTANALPLKSFIAKDAFNQKENGMNTYAIMCAESKDFDESILKDYTTTLGRPLGAIYYKHYPHEAFADTMTWIPDAEKNEVPIRGVDIVAWQGYKTPSQVADVINKKPHEGPPIDIKDYTYAFINLWSNFGKDGTLATLPDSMHSLASNLAPYVRPVTNEEYFLQMRLRMKPKETLTRYLAMLKNKLEELNSITPLTEASQNRNNLAKTQLTTAEKYLAQGNFQNCFNAAKDADKAVEISRLSYLTLTQQSAELVISVPTPAKPLFYYHPYELVDSPQSLKYKMQDWYIVEQFQIQVDKNEDFSNPTTNTFIKSDQYVMPNMSGPLYIRVRAQGREHHDWGVWSAPLKIATQEKYRLFQ